MKKRHSSFMSPGHIPPTTQDPLMIFLSLKLSMHITCPCIIHTHTHTHNNHHFWLRASTYVHAKGHERLFAAGQSKSPLESCVYISFFSYFFWRTTGYVYSFKFALRDFCALRDPVVVVAGHYMGEMWPPRYYQSYYASTILSATRHSLVFVQRVRRNPDTHTHIEKKQKKMGQSRRGFSHYQLIFSFFFFFLCVCVSLYPFSLSLSLSLLSFLLATAQRP